MQAANTKINPKQSERTAQTLAQFKAASSILSLVSLQSPPLILYLYSPKVERSPSSKNSQLVIRRMLQTTVERDERKKSNGD
jgi:hypothetical protein